MKKEKYKNTKQLKINEMMKNIIQSWKEIILFQKKTENIIKENKSIGNTAKEILLATTITAIIGLITLALLRTSPLWTILTYNDMTLGIAIFSTLFSPIIVLISTGIGIGISHVLSLIFGGKAEYGEYFATWGKIKAAITGTIGITKGITTAVLIILIPIIIVEITTQIQAYLTGLMAIFFIEIIGEIIWLVHGYKITKKQHKLNKAGAFISAVLPTLITYFFIIIIIILMIITIAQ